MVSYSTCSLNPVEDEAVVAAALSYYTMKTDPLLSFELVEVPHESLHGLMLHPGVESWRVADFDYDTTTPTNHDESADIGEDEEAVPKLQWYSSYQEAFNDGMDGVRASMWPAASNNHNIEQRCLSKCLRLLPQDQDTVIERTDRML